MTMSSTGGAYPNVTAEELAEARRYAMEIAWSSEDDVFVVSFPDAPGVMTHGSTREEAAAMGEDAIITWLTALHDVGRPVPPPASAAAGQCRRRRWTPAGRRRALPHREMQRVSARFVDTSMCLIRSQGNQFLAPQRALTPPSPSALV